MRLIAFPQWDKLSSLLRGMAATAADIPPKPRLSQAVKASPRPDPCK